MVVIIFMKFTPYEPENGTCFLFGLFCYRGNCAVKR